MSTASYDHLTKQQLVELLIERDRDTESNPHRKKYGLIWEEKPEQFEADSIGRIPVLQRDAGKCIFTSPDRPTHVLIQGDNYHALKVLTYTHERSVDVIYIDPPYNTGNKDFAYWDDFKEKKSFVDKDDSYRHSKWLSFMAKRLRLAKPLLRQTGVVLISIDDNEVFQLKLLCDEIFGQENFICQFIHKNNSNKNQAKLVGVSTEYMLCYAKSRAALKGRAWKTTKEGAAEVVSLYKKLVAQGLTLDEVEQEIRTLYRRPKYAHLSRWNKVDAQGVYMDADLSRQGGRKDYTIQNPATLQDCQIPARGWGKSETELLRLQRENLIHYGDGSTPPRMISYLTPESTEVPDSLLFFDNSADTREQQEMFGRVLFDYPKPREMLQHIIRTVAERDAIVLDFFAGSGTTAHAVLQLNAEDAGLRQCILVTNDEGEFRDSQGRVLPGGICTNVTLPRVQKAIEGYSTPSGKQVDGLRGNIAFYSTEFVEDRALERHRRDLSARSAEMLCLRESCYQQEEYVDKRWRSFTDGKGKRLVVVSDEFAANDLVPLLKADKRETVVYVFRFGDDEDPATEYGGKGLEHVTAKPVPDSLLALHRRIQKQEVKAV